MAIGFLALSTNSLYSTYAEKPAVRSPFSFEPLSVSAECGSQPLDSPFVLPEGFKQTIIETEESDPDFDDLPDMNQMNERQQTGRLLYRTHEVSQNGSISVTDLKTGETTVLAQRPDWERLDGLKWTPWGTLLAAEEVGPTTIPDPDFPEAVNGLVYEIDPETGDAVARPAVGSLAHEGIGIDPAGNVYIIDEFANGGIFKFVPDKRGDLDSGQLYVLRVVDEDTAPGDKTGEAVWIPLDRDAVQIDARSAALASNATAYNRPEDVEIIHNVLYVAITGEDRVLAIDLKGPEPFVTEFVRAGLNVPVEVDSDGGSDEVTGFANPDNLAVDNTGNLYIAEDNSPGDIWVATPDVDGDGMADQVVLFASLSDCRAEPTGILFGVAKEDKTLFVNVQHAGDGNDKAMAIRET